MGIKRAPALSNGQVEEIKDRYDAEAFPARPGAPKYRPRRSNAEELALEFGVSASCIRNIVLGHKRNSLRAQRCQRCDFPVESKRAVYCARCRTIVCNEGAKAGAALYKAKGDPLAVKTLSADTQRKAALALASAAARIAPGDLVLVLDMAGLL